MIVDPGAQFICSIEQTSKTIALEMVRGMAGLERIGLQEAIASLRAELIESVNASHGERLRFEVGEITMEFQIEVERSAEATGGIKFWVVELGTGGTAKDKDVHKVVIPLKPVREDGKPILTGSDEVPKAPASKEVMGK